MAIAKIKLALDCFLKTVGTKSKKRAATGKNWGKVGSI